MMDVWDDVAYQDLVEIEVGKLFEDAEVVIDSEAAEEIAA